MAKIYKLPEHIANLIAAGEVVERPGSVAKELIENAIDAGATRITVEIKHGGVSYLRVTDDGGGITPEDVRTAFMRHATSKILTIEDLSAISTMGFRGEALAAVASVSRVDMFTRPRHSVEGVQIVLEGGVEVSFSETGCPVGTTVVIRDLFFNVPARAKFLKKDATESAYVESAVVAAAIARPDIAFTLIKDGRESLFSPGDGKMLSAILATCGRGLEGNLLHTVGSFGRITADGYVSPPSVSRAGKNMQFFFVNARPVRSRLLSAAVEQAYKGRLLGGRHPACFLALGMHSSAVDVNVHPAKLEVKFSNEKEVFSAVYNAVQTALAGLDASIRIAETERVEDSAQGEKMAQTELPTPVQQTLRLDTGRPSYTFSESFAGSNQKAYSGLSIDYKTRADNPGQPAQAMVKPDQAPEYLKPVISPAVDDGTEPEAVARSAGPVESIVDEPPGEAVRIVGEAFKTYIIAEDAKGLWLIDKHAAHERIIYNELTAALGDMPSQVLLSPIRVMLSRVEKAVCLDNLPAFSQAGFEIEDFGAGALIVRQAPTYLEAEDIAFAVTDMAARLLEERPSGNGVLDALLSSMACKRAIKAGQYTSSAEMQAFAQRVLASPEVRNCPHGRPVLTYLSRYDMEKMFGRVQ